MFAPPETAAASGGVDKPPSICTLLAKNLTPDTPNLKPRLLYAIKSAVRSSDAETRAAVPALITELRKPHSQVRYLAVLITDELFMRSKLFRILIVDRLDEFLTLSVGFRAKLPLPPPTGVATALRSKSIEILEKWNDSFGIYYRQLRLGFNYLKNILHYRFPNRLETESRRQRERREKEARTRLILLDKFDRLKENYVLINDEVRSTVNEIEECLDMLHSDNNAIGDISDDEDGVEEFTSLTMRRIRQEALKEAEMVREDMDNKPIFDVLRESHKVLVMKHMPSVREWLTVLVRVDIDPTEDNSRDAGADSRFRDAALKDFIDLRNLVQSVEKRSVELGCSMDEKPEEEEEDFWEEGTIEISKPAPDSSIEAKLPKSSIEAPTTNKGKGVVSGKPAAPPIVKKASIGMDSSLAPERTKLLAEAPVLNWGPFLDNWGSKQDVFANQRGMELDNHWGRVDYDATIPAEKIAELNVHRMVYKEEPVEALPCLAPLRKGGLCQRRDLKVCPFHGPIVPRDGDGNPIEQIPSGGEIEKELSTQPKESSSEETGQMSDSVAATSESAEERVERLAKQAVKNVREREMKMKALKRARLASVREHNDTVLRESALASTSYSERATASHEPEIGRLAKRAKSGSKLKKVTPKDRIAQRLLKTKVTEASVRQIVQGEHSKYREAFPNQW